MKFTSQIKQLTFDELKSSLDNLPKSNRWVKLGDELPWDEIEKIYNARLNNDKKGAGNKPARLVIGALIIKHKMNLSDEDTINIIQENPYMQYMLGLSEFTSKPVFDPSLFVTIRKRLQVEDFNRFTESLMKCKRTDSQDDADADNNDDETTHGGTLKVDATCSDAEVRYPTDLDILHDGCKAVERIIDRFCKLADIQRPDTHMKKIHKRYAKTVKKKVKPNKDLKECRRYLIAHLSRNIRTCLDLMAHHSTDSFNALNEWDKRLLFITIKRKTKSERVYRANNIRGKLADTGAAWTAACYFAKNVMKFLRNLLHALFLLLDFRSILSTKRLSYENYAILA